jgi:RNA polymerase sigma-70 factor (ECF subfamily)
MVLLGKSTPREGYSMSRNRDDGHYIHGRFPPTARGGEGGARSARSAGYGRRRAAEKAAENTNDDLAIERKWLIRGRMDEAKFGLAYQRYYERIYRFLYWKVLNHELAEDLTSITFLRAQQKLWTWRFQGRKFGAWLFNIAHKVYLEEVRKARRRTGIESLAQQRWLENGQPDPLGELLQAEETRRLYACLAELNELGRTIIILRYSIKCRHAEIGAILGMSEGNVRTREKRCREKMRALWNSQVDLADDRERYLMDYLQDSEES